MSSAILEKVRTRGYWTVLVRPVAFVKKRVQPITGLFPLVRQNAVQLRGWDFPHIDTHNDPHIGQDWAGQEYEWEHYLESWRLYQSGQFISIFAMPEDWRDQSHLWPPDEGWQPLTRMGVVDTIYVFTEAYEFASRLAATDAGSDEMVVSVEVAGIEGRVLWMEDPARELFHSYVARLPSFRYSQQVPRASLTDEAWSLARAGAVEVLRRFGWEPAPQVVESIQSGLRRQ